MARAVTVNKKENYISISIRIQYLALSESYWSGVDSVTGEDARDGVADAEDRLVLVIGPVQVRVPVTQLHHH